MPNFDMNVYTDFINVHIPQVLTQVDREPHSKTYGSCDRNYWHLKIRDFSSGILQQTALTMALLYTIKFPRNIYYHNSLLKEWSVAALRYMGKIQLQDGSFNEYYPNEHGFPPTAFNLFAGCKAYIILDLSDKKILATLRRCAKWLAQHFESHAYNQEIASIAGLEIFYQITHEEFARNAVNMKVQRLMMAYSSEGWFPEQGGADIGYSSVAFDMLMEYYTLRKDERVEFAIHGMVKFLSRFVHPDGTVGGEYGSRNTIYFMPNGLETYVDIGMDIHDIAKKMLYKIYGKNQETNYGDFMHAVDERYLTHYVMHSYLRALQRFHRRDVNMDSLFIEKEGVEKYPQAGLMVLHQKNAYGVFAASKGGIIKLYIDNKEVICDCGYQLMLPDKKIAVTNWLDDTYHIEWLDNGCKVTGNFNIVKQRVQNPIYHMCLRIGAFFLGKQLNTLIKEMTIYQKHHAEATFTRVILLQDEKLQILDTINNPGDFYICKASNISLRLVASGNFFSRSDLLNQVRKEYGQIREFQLEKCVDLQTGEVKEVQYGH